MDNTALRDQMISFLRGRQSHMPLEDAVKGFPLGHINDIFPNGEYSFWHLLEHMRFTQKDILDFMLNPDYSEPEWPKDYWPARSMKATPAIWENTINECQKDIESLIAMVEDPELDLSAKVPNGTGQIYLREFMLVFDHNSYHVGEFAIMRQVLKLW